jgi:hypothetical protein
MILPAFCCACTPANTAMDSSDNNILFIYMVVFSNLLQPPAKGS